MAKRKIYTAEDAKFIKHLRNKMYYYNKKLAEWNERYMLPITFKNIRSVLTEDEAYVLLYLFNDTDAYYVKDFRAVAVEEGGYMQDFISKISVRLGYGSVDEYVKSQARGQELQNTVDTTTFIYNEFRKLARG